MLAQLQDTSQNLGETVTKQLAALRQKVEEPPDVSLSEFTKMQSKVQAAVVEAAAASKEITTLKVGCAYMACNHLPHSHDERWHCTCTWAPWTPSHSTPNSSESTRSAAVINLCEYSAGAVYA